MSTHTGDYDNVAPIDAEHAGYAASRRRPADTFAVRLLLSRYLDGLTISEAASRCGLNDATWATWESGRRPRDILDVCRRVADALDIDHDWLLLGGPLAGARGVPTNRAGRDTGRYPATAERPTPVRPNGVTQPGSPTPTHRRAVRVQLPMAA